MADYTPDTYRVRRVYSLAPPNLAGCDHVNPAPDYAGAQFDRWLAQERAEAAARAVSEMGDWFMQQGFDRDVTAAQACYERAARLRAGER